MLSLIVAINKKGYIGNKGKLPWHDQHDLLRFYELTEFRTCIAGRKTYESLPKFFLSTRRVLCASHKNTPLDSLIRSNPDAFILGGAEIYRQALTTGLVKYFYISVIDDESEGDTLFPMDALKASGFGKLL